MAAQTAYAANTALKPIASVSRPPTKGTQGEAEIVDTVKAA